MADYSGRQYIRPIDRGPSPPSTQGRNLGGDFAMIFGAPPSGSRSQTMTSGSMSFEGSRAQASPPQPADYNPRQPPPRPGYSGPESYQIPVGTSSPPFQHQQAPSSRYPPQPTRPDRRQYPSQRNDVRPSPPPAQHHSYTRPGPGPRPYPPPSHAPALNSASYRTQSLATSISPSLPPQATGSYSMASAQAFRQQPYMNHHAQTTPQGRVVPERADERAMSMSSYHRDNDYAQSQTMSGRVIPNRRRESAGMQDGAHRDHRPSADGTAASHAYAAGRATRHSSADTQHSRTMSMASTIAPSDRTYSMSQASTQLGEASRSNSQSARPRRRAPAVYAALLSKVADAFRERIVLSDKEKDGLVYKSAFSGSEAVDLICYIIQTTDRNLALLLGRSLDAQKFFHDVTYDHRLRDSAAEMYQFRETLVEEGSDVNGVFTLTSECYSPTCTADRLCYSIACPKRIDQQKRLNMGAQPGLKRQDSRTSLHAEQSDEQKLWINTVSKEVSDSVTDREKKRQEVISELCYTERDFVKDLEYLNDFWVRPLRSYNQTKPSPIPEQRRDKFVRTVFANCQDVYAVNSRLAEALTRRQQQNPVVRNIGDIVLEYVPRFGPFIQYGSNQMFGKYEYEREKQANPAFARFAAETERLKESRKLELNGYLTKPTTRLARYPLLLESVLKNTADDNPDKHDLPKAIAAIREVLTEVNKASGQAENRFTLVQLNQQLIWRPGEFIDLKLTDESRQLLYRGLLKRQPADQQGDIQAFLFDNALIHVRTKTVNKREEMKVYKKPIPLGLLVVSGGEDGARSGLTKRPSSSLLPGSRSNTMTSSSASSLRQQGYPITFRHLGRGGYELTLYCTSEIQRSKWVKAVHEQQDKVNKHDDIFTAAIINQGFFNGALRVNCCVPVDGGRRLVIGTDSGVYVTDRRKGETSTRPKKVLEMKSVTQVDVLEQHSILLVLGDKTLYSFPIEALEPDDNPLGASKRGKKISHANFFKVGVFDGQHLVCCVRTTSLSATIKVYKPMESMTNSKKKSGFSRMLSSGQDVLKPFKEFYIPTETYSIHFLRASLCVGCAKGFEIVTLDTLVTQPLLDQADTSLDFVATKENLRPIFVERINSSFLLCYSDFSFFVNKHGWRARPDWKISWEGNPQAFAIFQPYILAFEPNFVEVRNMEEGGTVAHTLAAKNVRMLHSSTREILFAFEDEMTGDDVIASLDFWISRADGK